MRQREDGACFAYTKSDGACFVLPRSEHERLRAEWMRGCAIANTSADCIADQRADAAEDQREDAL
jgi:hypothetical protein